MQALPRHHPGMSKSSLKEHHLLLAQGLLSNLLHNRNIWVQPSFSDIYLTRNMARLLCTSLYGCESELYSRNIKLHIHFAVFMMQHMNMGACWTMMSNQTKSQTPALNNVNNSTPICSSEALRFYTFKLQTINSISCQVHIFPQQTAG